MPLLAPRTAFRQGAQCLAVGELDTVCKVAMTTFIKLFALSDKRRDNAQERRPR
jgi:hypothetical protein